MSDLFVFEFLSEADAEVGRRDLMVKCASFMTDIANAVITLANTDGTIKINQLIYSSAKGFPSRSVRDVLLGLALRPKLGATSDKQINAVSEALANLGMEQAFLRDAAEALHSSKATLFILLTGAPPAESLKVGAATLIGSTSYSDQNEATLRSALWDFEAGSDSHAIDGDLLDGALEDTFPASDPVSLVSSRTA